MQSIYCKLFAVVNMYEIIIDTLLGMLFRKSSNRDEEFTAKKEEFVNGKLSIIRCPFCKWSPKESSRWDCWDCDYPEYFYAGCGTQWNTFETQGVCPTCSYKWKWTSCLQCGGWAKHEDWYVSDYGTE